MAATSWRTFNRMMAEVVPQAGNLAWGDWQVRMLRFHDVVGLPSRPRPVHAHAWFELSVVTEGAVAFAVDGRERHLGRGATFAMPPGHQHAWRTDGRALITGFQLLLLPTGAGSRPALERWQAGIAADGWSLPAHPLALALVDELHQLAGGRPAAISTAAMLARSLALWLLDRLEAPSTVAAANCPDLAGDDRLVRLHDHLLAHLAEDLPLAALARRAGITPRHLNRLFARAYGLPVHRFILQQRMDRATHALTWSDAPVAAVARNLGFDDPDHFGRLFRRWFGTTPERWRQDQHPARDG